MLNRPTAKLVRGAALAAALMACQASSAAPLLYEGFDYPESSTLSGNGPWSTISTGSGPPTIGAASLSYPGLPASTGRSALHDRTNSGGSRITLPGQPYDVQSPASSITLYYSLLVTLNDFATFASTSPDGSFFAGFNNGVGTDSMGGALDQAGQLLVRKDPLQPSTHFQLGVAKNNGVPRAFDATQSFLPGDMAFVVVSYTINAGDDNDVAQLWVNPTPGGPMPASPSAVAGIGADLGTVGPFSARGTRQLSSFYLRNNSIQPGHMQVDELRVGLAYADVTPGSAPAFTADFNSSGGVDGLDLAKWRSDFGPTAGSDADSDGDSDGADFLAWQRQLGSGLPSTVASAAVPEPAARLLAVLAGIGGWAGGRKTTSAKRDRIR